MGLARMLATIRLTRPNRLTVPSRNPLAPTTATRPESPFRRTVSRAVATATGSLSRASTRAGQSRAAATARMPEPVPTSSARRIRRRRASQSRASRQPWVDSWRPEPKAAPASTRRTKHRRGGAWCAPTIVKRPIEKGGKEVRDWASQSVAHTGSTVGSSCASLAAWRIASSRAGLASSDNEAAPNIVTCRTSAGLPLSGVLLGLSPPVRRQRAR